MFGIIAGAVVLFARGPMLSAQAVGTIQGHVTTPDGVPVLDASVTVVGSALASRSAAEGRFEIRGVPEGTHTVRVQRLGFRASDFTTSVVPGQIATLEVKLLTALVVLDTSRVEGRSGLEKPARLAYTNRYDQFYERRKGGMGRYFTHEDIDRIVTGSLVDVIRTVPSMQVRRVNNHFEVNLPGCPQGNFQVWVDNINVWPPAGQEADGSMGMDASYSGPGSSSLASSSSSSSGQSSSSRSARSTNAPNNNDTANQTRLTPMDVLTDYAPEHVEAIEVYTGAAGMPPESRGNSCAAIFVWTR
jgi:hypothetical protein